MPVPKLLPTQAMDATAAGVTYHIQGELVPVLHLELSQMPIYFEHHVLLWKEPSVTIGIKSLAGAFKRLFAGMPLIMIEASGVGHIGFSRDGAGHLIALPIAPGQSLNVREHQFLAATDNLSFDFEFVKGAANILFGGTGLFVDTFSCSHSDDFGGGMLWLHGHGNVFEVNLAVGEAIDIEPGGWIYKDPTVRMETMYQGLKTGLFASAGNLAWNRFHGPGRVGVQSMYMPEMSGGQSSDNPGSSVGNAVGGILGSFLKG